jgi:hypothetical protein
VGFFRAEEKINSTIWRRSWIRFQGAAMGAYLLYVAIAILFLPTVLSVAHAEMVFIGWGAPAEIRLRVGAPVGITTVNHSVPATNVGDGTPIAGTPNSVLIEASARRANIWQAFTTNFIISVDSSVPLSSGGNTISFTDISWTAQDGDIPSGSFNGIPGQVILGPTTAFLQVRDWHTFYYNNIRIVPYGIYTGRVTYTAAVP